MLSVDLNELKSAIESDIGAFFKSNNLETPLLVFLNHADSEDVLYFSVLIGIAARKQLDEYIQTTYRASKISDFKGEQNVHYGSYVLTKDTIEDMITIFRIKGYL